METIKYSGDNDKRINLVILSEGYQTMELDQFILDATNFSNAMFSQSPFLEYSDYFNVYAIKVPSNESGADHPANATDVSEPLFPAITVDTYFNATFDAFGYHRFLYYGIDYTDAAIAEQKIISVLADNFPNYDQTLLLVNTTEYGGTGGQFPIASVSSFEISIHELGHSLFNLKDEYLLPDIFYAEAINMTQENDPDHIKWKNWLNINDVGIYPHSTTGVPSTWHRPHQNCKMRALDAPFCSVCKEGMVKKIHDLLSPIDSFTPENTVNNPNFPLNFELTLIKPKPNTLMNEWTLNGTVITNNVDAIEILENNLVDGINTLTVVITDESPLLKLDAHETVHINSVSWTINYASLNIEEITSNTQEYNISIYPNPLENIVNFKIESDAPFDLKAELTTLEGKRLGTVQLNNSNQTIDINYLKSGIYLVNFYSNKALITSKKIVKQ
ncbi:hypothetical protein MHTCC0001_11850 [Flavobacteriaceae bacterium MHTCC 0001]